MGQSKRLRVSDVRAVFRLIGECRELGIDSTLWRRHMLTELARLTGAQVSMASLAGSPDSIAPVSLPLVDVGWSGAREREVFVQFFRDRMYLEDPVLQALGPVILSLTSSAAVTHSRRELADDRAWYRSSAYSDYHRAMGVDDWITSLMQLPDGRPHMICLHRPVKAQAFSPQEQQLLHIFHAELAPHLLTDLATPGVEPISSLPPRLRQVLACLLEGDSEKQAASRLGLTRDTAHQYVKAVYRHLKVSTRAELMARFVRFPSRALRLTPESAGTR